MKLPFDESRDSIQSMAAQHSKTVTYWMGGEYSSNIYLKYSQLDGHRLEKYFTDYLCL